MDENMKSERINNRVPVKAASAFTLVEVVVTIVIIMVLATGAMGQQFHASKMARQARAKYVAANVGQLVMENWKAKGGDENFDPTDLDLGFTKDKTGSVYQITTDDTPLFVKLSYKDLETDPLTGITLREINVVVQWNFAFTETTPTDSDPSIELTSYIRLDESGG